MEMKAYEFDEDTVITTASLDEAKQWYYKDVGNYPTDVTELDPETDTIFYFPDKNKRLNEITLIPANEADIHQFSLIDGDIYERITIEEAWVRDGSLAGTFIIASSEH